MCGHDGQSPKTRQELRGTQVAVTVVFPGLIKTDLLNNAFQPRGAASGEHPARKAQQYKMVHGTSAGDAASDIINGVRQNMTRVLVGEDARHLDVIVRKNPGNYGAVLKNRFKGKNS